MAFSASAAIIYNNEWGFPSDIIKVMVGFVGGQISYTWTPAAVQAVSTWQKANQLDDDGMVGPATLEKLIQKMEDLSKYGDSRKVRACWDEKRIAAHGIGGPITPQIIKPFGFSKYQARHPKTGLMCDWWTMMMTFQVNVALNPNLHLYESIEYRQYIKGEAWIYPGELDAKGAWNPLRPRESIGKYFAIPGDRKTGQPKGLLKAYKEDGKSPEFLDSVNFRFGRRGNDMQSPEFATVWSPNEEGPDYMLRDSPGYGQPYDSNHGDKVEINVTFKGQIVQVKLLSNGLTEKVKVYAEKEWTYNSGQMLLRWGTF